MQKFRYIIKEYNSESIYIEGYLPITTGCGESKNWLYLSKKSIPLLCSKLTEEAIFTRKIPTPIQNSIDHITFDYSASRERPAICLTLEHKDNNKVLDGVLDIPIHPLGDKEGNMTYIRPFLEELKRYAE